MARCVDMEVEHAELEAARRYPFGTCFHGYAAETNEDGEPEFFFAHYKRGHGRRARSLRRAAGWPMRLCC